MTKRRSMAISHMRRDEAVEFLDRTARAISQTMGQFCETLVQEISDASLCTVLAIYNGHVSGRQVGSTLSIYGQDTSLDDTGLLGRLDDMVSYEVVTPTGRRIKSTTIPLRGHGYLLALGINLDITALSQANEVISGLASVGSDLREGLGVSSTGGPSESDALVNECLHQLGKPAESLSRQDRLQLVRMLSDRGFFNFQKGATTLASRLGVSRSTIYGDLKAMG